MSRKSMLLVRTIAITLLLPIYVAACAKEEDYDFRSMTSIELSGGNSATGATMFIEDKEELQLIRDLLTKMEEKVTRNTVVITAPRGYMNFRNSKIPFLIISDDCLVIGNREYYGVNECRRIRELMEGYLN
ncbi:MAG: hypothetical protein JW708_10735 [Vallitaleaceae bacterium]|nr:hypothetical protein [Vallitaleaceae bacterium]